MAGERPRSAMELGSHVSHHGMDLSSPEREGLVSPDGSSKKKKFAPLKSLKRFFAGTKKKKPKDDVTGVGIKSSSCDELESKQDPSRGELAGSNLMSMSADSVFSGDRGREKIEFTRSMEVIPGHNFKDELARKLHGRRSDDDEGLPSSPPGHLSTVDALIENGLQEKSMSMDSDHSLLSMDSSEAELEEEFFKRDWASSSGHLAESPGGTLSNDLDLDLDVVASTSSLNISAAKHKIAVKPKTKARTTAHNQRRRTASPKPTTGVMVLPKLKEETTTAEVITTTLDEEDVDQSHEKLESTDDEIEVDIRSHELRSDQSDDQLEEPEVQEMSMDFSDKTGLSSEDETKESPRDEKSDEEKVPERTPSPIAPAVVLRKKDSLLKQDSSKRSTIACENVEVKEVTPFGERKVKRSSLIMEGRNWDDLGKPKEKDHESTTSPKGSEFANVFAKFQKTSSVKKPDDRKPQEANKGTAVFKSDQPKHTPVVNKVSDSGKVTVGFNVQNKPSVMTAKPSLVSHEAKNKKIVIEKKESNEIKSEKVDVKQKTVIIQKSNDDDKEKVSNVLRREKVESAKDTGKRDSGTKRTSVELISKRISGEEVPKRTSGEVLTKRTSGDLSSKKISAETEIKTAPESTSKQDDTKKSHVQSATESENKTITATKVSSKFVSVHQKAALGGGQKSDSVSSRPSKTAEKDTVNGDNSLVVKSTPHKRDSPRSTNRLRSQTLPDSQPPSKDAPSMDTDPSALKRANSHEAGVNKENIPSSAASSVPQKSSVLRSAAGTRPTPQKLGGAGGKPSWVEMARKRTEGWNDDHKEDGSDRSKSSEEEMKDKRSSVLDLMKRFQ